MRVVCLSNTDNGNGTRTVLVSVRTNADVEVAQRSYVVSSRAELAFKVTTELDQRRLAAIGTNDVVAQD